MNILWYKSDNLKSYNHSLWNNKLTPKTFMKVGVANDDFDYRTLGDDFIYILMIL